MSGQRVVEGHLVYSLGGICRDRERLRATSSIVCRLCRDREAADMQGHSLTSGFLAAK